MGVADRNQLAMLDAAVDACAAVFLDAHKKLWHRGERRQHLSLHVISEQEAPGRDERIDRTGSFRQWRPHRDFTVGPPQADDHSPRRDESDSGF
ncbi:hypothetical protein ACFRAR_19855 [Kitasatospora sp. NPDC056651]|uniref:hypothetical protein n=1 Tax=Kitasatospora sp. NPDC056651 TaxID=3345892 RepID=UPI0036CC93A1